MTTMIDERYLRTYFEAHEQFQRLFWRFSRAWNSQRHAWEPVPLPSTDGLGYEHLGLVLRILDELTLMGKSLDRQAEALDAQVQRCRRIGTGGER